MSVIGNGVFGVDAEAYKREESEFVKSAKEFIVSDVRYVSIY